MVIYQKCINQEELVTGQPSSRPFNVNQSEALQSPDVVQILSEHVESLRLMTDEFLNAIIQTVNSVPYGMRTIARELRIVMEEAFPDEHPEEIIKTLGNFIYYRYLSPAITAPEQYDVINCDVSPIQRRNLAEVGDTFVLVGLMLIYILYRYQKCFNKFRVENHLIPETRT